MKAVEERPARKPERKVRVPQSARLVRFFLHPVGMTLLGLMAVVALTSGGLFIHFYLKYAKLLDERLRGGTYATTSRIYAAPNSIAVNDAASPGTLPPSSGTQAITRTATIQSGTTRFARILLRFILGTNPISIRTPLQ